MSEKALKEVAEAAKSYTDQKGQELRTAIGEVSSILSDLDKRFQQLGKGLQQSSGSQRGEGDLPTYKCKGKDCRSSFEDVGDLVAHYVEEHLPENLLVKAPEPEAKPEPKRHKTAKEFVDCPECRASLLREFEAAGWKVAKPEPSQPKKEKRGLFG